MTSKRSKVALSYGSDMDVSLELIESQIPGPTLLVLGGVHGDELTGIFACMALADRLVGANFKGTVRLVPIANPKAALAVQRTNPEDGLNLARVFPGNELGSLSECLAAAITTGAIEGSDALIDLHTATTGRFMPFFTGYRLGDDKAEAMARVFGADLLWGHPEVLQGRTVSTAAEMGIPWIYVESGTGSTTDERQVERYVDGVLRVMGVLGMLDEETAIPSPVQTITAGTGDMDTKGLVSPYNGLLKTLVAAGSEVAPGDPVATVIDVAIGKTHTVEADQAGVIMRLTVDSPISEGESLAIIVPV